MKNSGVISYIVAIIGLAFGIFQWHSSEEKDERLSAIDRQPRISIVGTPVVRQMNVAVKTNVLSLDTAKFRQSGDSVLPGVFYVQVNDIKTELLVINRSRYLGRIVGAVQYDSLSMTPVIRRYLKSMDVADDNFEMALFSKPYNVGEGDTIRIPFEGPLQFALEDRFMLHYLILFESESGHLYDIYYWIEYRIRPSLLPLGSSLKDLSRKHRTMLTDFGKLLEVIDKSFDPKIYEVEEGKKLLDKLDRAAKIRAK
jgi:hypothetical protein